MSESCWKCMGDGGWHDCGEDCCCCLEPEINVICEECNGNGEYDEYNARLIEALEKVDAMIPNAESRIRLVIRAALKGKSDE